MRVGARRLRWSAWVLSAAATVVAMCAVPHVHAEDVTHAARLSYLDGEVTVERADNTGADPAQLNQPLLEGARLVTANGEAEIELEDGSVVRLTPRTALAITALDHVAGARRETVITLLYGLMYAELRVMDAAGTTILAGPDCILPLSNAALRVGFDQPPPAVAALTGSVRVEHAGADAASSYQVSLQAGEWLRENGAQGRAYTVEQQIPHDTWDDWNEHRAQAALDDSAERTVARDGYAGDQGYGWSDLDSNGFWYDVAGQNLVWQPFAASAPGFDPYGDGSWVAAGGAGYVWASAYAWGWTPYRCGTWAYSDNFGWGWSPNAVCGVGGWHFGANGGLNVSRVPPGYQRPLPPNRQGPPRAHPIMVAGSAPARRQPVESPQRLYGGVPSLPLRPIAPALVTRGSSAVGSALSRDFAVDRSTRQPVFGLARPPADGSPVRTLSTTTSAAARDVAVPGPPATSGRRPEYDRSSGRAVGAPAQVSGAMATPGAARWPAQEAVPSRLGPGLSQPSYARPVWTPPPITVHAPSPVQQYSAPSPVHVSPPSAPVASPGATKK